MLVCIALQESELAHRRQTGGGPARGYWQFERAGVTGVLTHAASRAHAAAICARFDVTPVVAHVYAAVEFHDVLAAAFARLLIWTLPQRLPGRGAYDRAWSQYLDAWRPGTPRPKAWFANYQRAWAIVEPKG